jgi:hypothetical protein
MPKKIKAQKKIVPASIPTRQKQRLLFYRLYERLCCHGYLCRPIYDHRPPPSHSQQAQLQQQAFPVAQLEIIDPDEELPVTSPAPLSVTQTPAPTTKPIDLKVTP